MKYLILTTFFFILDYSFPSLYARELSAELREIINLTSKNIVSRMSDEEKAGQVIHVSIPGKELTEAGIAEIKKIKPGGVILFGTNLGTSEDIRTLTEALQEEAQKNKILPLFISTDQEGGRVIRVRKSVTEFPGAMAVGQTGNEEYAEQVGFITSYQLNRLGINVLLAPSLDINNNPENPVINTRSFGSDLETVSRIATAYERGAREGGALPVIKHFPGHGDTNVDSHLGLPVIEKDMDQILNFELVPFKKSIESGARAVMSAHIVYPKIDPKYPATLSREILTGILREKLGFQGLVFTDAMEMDAISKNYKQDKRGILAILAGADVILLTSWGKNTKEYYDMILEGIKNGDFVVGERNYLEESLIRQIATKIEFGLISNEISNPGLKEFISGQKTFAREKFANLKKNSIKDLNTKISSDAIRSLREEFTPLSPELAMSYQFFLKSKPMRDEAKLLGFHQITEKRFAKIIKEGVKGRFVLETNSQSDLEKLSRMIKSSPQNEYILLHTGSPYLNFPEIPKISVLLSFSPTKASQVSLFRRVFQSPPEEKVQPCNLILKTKK